MEFKEITSQANIDTFLLSIYWEHAFFREVYILSPSYIYPDGSKHVNPDRFPDIAMIILTFDEKYPAIELKFQGVEAVNLSFAHNIKPQALVLNNKIEFHFNSQTSIKAKRISFRVLEKQEAFGDKVKYGKNWDELFE